MAASTRSFLVEILATTGRLAKDDISATMEKLATQISDVKNEVFESLQKNYVDFYPNLSRGVELSGQLETLSRDVASVTTRVDTEIRNQLSVSTAEFERLSSQLDETTHVLSMLTILVQIDELLQQIDKQLAHSDSVSAGESLQRVGALIERGTLSRSHVNVLAALKTSYNTKKQTLVQLINAMWTANVRCVLPDEEGGGKKLETRLTVVGGGGGGADKAPASLHNMLQATQNAGLMPHKLQTLTTLLLEHFMRPLVTRHGSEIGAESGRDEATLVVLTPRKHSHLPVCPTDALASLHILFSFLHTHLLGFSITEESADSGEQRTTPLMTRVGQMMASDCLLMVVSDCFARSIPTSVRDLDAFPPMAQRAISFQQALINWGFIPPDNTVLSDFVGNVNALFAKKKCEEMMTKARSLMTSDVHNTVLLSEQTSGELGVCDFGRTGGKGSAAAGSRGMLQCGEERLSGNTFTLPACHVSQYVVQLMDLAYETLDEAAGSSEACATQLFYFVRLLFELFSNVVPTYHKEALATLPQMAALHHNDCMYLAHQLLMLGHQYQSQLPDSLAAPTFVDLVPHLRRLGVDCLLRSVAKQRQTLLACLASTSGLINVAEKNNFVATEKAIKQMLHQLQHLGRVWTVLPSAVYWKILGSLLDAVIAELMSSVIALEDISTDDASQLHHLLSIIVSRAPASLRPSTATNKESAAALCKHVSQWLKLTELMMVLTASLQDINDRWADGKGPLSQWLTADELKQLVRALFQNTDRRAAILASLK